MEEPPTTTTDTPMTPVPKSNPPTETLDTPMPPLPPKTSLVHPRPPTDIMSLDPISHKRTTSPPPLPTPPSKKRRTATNLSDGKPIFHVLLSKTPKAPTSDTTTPTPAEEEAEVCVVSSHGSFHLARDAAREFLVEKCGGDYLMESPPSAPSTRASTPLLELDKADPNNSDMDDEEEGERLFPKYKDGMEHLFLLTGTDSGYKYRLTIQRCVLPAEAPGRTYLVVRERKDMDEVLLEKSVVAVYGDRERANARARQILREVEGVTAPGLRSSKRRRSSGVGGHGTSVSGGRASGKSERVVRKRQSLGEIERSKYEESMDARGYYTGVVYAEGDRVCVRVEGWEVS